MMKQAILRSLAGLGVGVRRIDRHAVNGVDLLQDVRVLLADKPGPLLFDVGANVGQTVDQFRAIFTKPRIVSFEPSPRTFETLRARHGRSPDLRLENLALGSINGTVDFYVTSRYSVNDSILAPTWSEDMQRVQVPVETLEAYCARNSIATIDFLKIDAQGYDLEVLRGASQLLSERRIGLVAAEITLAPMYAGQPSLLDILNFVTSFRYELVGFYEQTYNRNKLVYLNICFSC